LFLERLFPFLTANINQLLDFSKINRFVRMSRRKAGSRLRGIHQEGSSLMETGMMNLYTDVSLDSLVEEVVESVYAGHSYQQLSASLARGVETGAKGSSVSSTLRRLGSLGPMESDSDKPLTVGHVPRVDVYLNVDPSVQWMYYTQPGAIRRVVMNLFGNALKYTTQGFIVVTLTQDTNTGVKKNSRRMVTLSISDSGKGIGAEYLKHQLFSPFAQEDHLATGVGLGLSLVKQITTALGGRITVDSQVRRGTTVRVSLPLRRSRLDIEKTSHAGVDFTDQVQQLKGHSVCVVGFNSGTSANNPLLSLTSPSSPKATMGRICHDWLQMKLLSESDDSSPTFYICTEDDLDEISIIQSKPDVIPPPVIVVCHDASVAHDLATRYQSSRTGRVYEFISQP
jgi:hypothetical protein